MENNLIRREYDYVPDSVYWNEDEQIVQCHKTGIFYEQLTNIEREKRGLPPFGTELSEDTRSRINKL